MKFSDKQMERYARHIILPELGGVGQEKLLAASRRLPRRSTGVKNPMVGRVPKLQGFHNLPGRIRTRSDKAYLTRTDQIIKSA